MELELLLRLMSGMHIENYPAAVVQSAYWDMLHDHDRNAKYNEAIKQSVASIHKSGKQAVALDIGTGCGVLAMMAAKAGADHVYACEEVPWMVQVATDVIKENNLNSRITLIGKSSFDLSVGMGRADDMKTKANLLITELFASTIFDERVVETINDAKRRLLAEDCIIIPHNLVIFAQVVDYPDVGKENWIHPMILTDGTVINFPEGMKTCSSKSNMTAPTQISSLTKDEFTVYSNPLELFKLELGGNGLVNETDMVRLPFESTGTGIATAIFSWWTLELDKEREINITLKPYWAGGSANDVRYHWSPVVYYGQADFELKENTRYYLEGFRGKQYSEGRIDMCFRISSSSNIILPNPQPWDNRCQCGFHGVSTYQVRKWNDQKLMGQYVLALKSMIVPGHSILLCLSDATATILHIIAHYLGAKKIYVKLRYKTDGQRAARFAELCGVNSGIEFVTSNQMQSVAKKVTAVIGDPFFMKDQQSPMFNPFSTLSHVDDHEILWYHLRYFRFLQEMGLTSNQTRLSPFKAVIRGVLMRFEKLSRINTPLRSILEGEFTINGFADSYMDKAVEDPSGVGYEFLWQFPGIACCESFDILDIHNDGVLMKTSTSECKAEREELEPNGLAIWIDWHLAENVIASYGPASDIVVGNPVKWTNVTKQAVKLHHCGWKDAVKFTTEYSLLAATVRFEFNNEFE